MRPWPRPGGGEPPSRREARRGPPSGARAAGVALALAAGLAACGPGARPTAGARPPGAAPAPAPVFAGVPDDTPYLVALEPDALADLAGFLARSTRAAAREGLARLAGMDGPGAAAARALAGLLDGPLADLPRRLGLPPGGRVVLHGLGPYPVLRLPLADPRPLRRLVEALATDPALAARRARAGGRPYVTLGVGDALRAVLSVGERDAALALLPADRIEAALPALLGAAPPARPLSLRRVDPSLAALPPLLLYADLDRGRRAVEAAIPGRDAWSGCGAVVEGLARAVPSLTLAYVGVGPRRLTARVLVELSADERARLAAVRGALPAPAVRAAPPALEVGLALDAAALAAWVQATFGQMAARSTGCAPAEGAAEGFAPFAPRLAGGLGPADGVRGARLTVESIGPAGDLQRATAAVLSRDAGGLVALLALLPSPAAATLAQDGEPVELSLGLLNLRGKAFVAATADRVVAAKGEDGAPDDDARDRAAELARAPLAPRSPLAHVLVDLRALGRDDAIFDPAEAPDDDVAARLGVVTVDLDLDDRGLAATLTASP